MGAHSLDQPRRARRISFSPPAQGIRSPDPHLGINHSPSEFVHSTALGCVWGWWGRKEFDKMDPDLRQRSLHTQARSSLQKRRPPRTQTSGSSLPPSRSCSPFCLTSCPDLTRQPFSRLHLSIPRSGGLRSQATPKLASFWGRGSSGTRPGVVERAEGSSSLRLPPPGDRGRGTLLLGNLRGGPQNLASDPYLPPNLLHVPHTLLLLSRSQMSFLYQWKQERNTGTLIEN